MDIANLNALFVNKADLEKALRTKLDFKAIARDVMPDYLSPYLPREFLTIYEAIPLLKGENPQKHNHNRDSDFYSYYRALYDAVSSGRLQKSVIACEEFDFDYGDLRLHREDLEQWAREYGYYWGLPPFKPLDQPTAQNVDALQRLLDETKAENTQLKNELESLKANAIPTEPAAYNPTERETHLLLIYALSTMLAKGSKNVAKYLIAKRINVSALAAESETQIRELVNDFDINARTQRVLRARISEALQSLQEAE